MKGKKVFSLLMVFTMCLSLFLGLTAQVGEAYAEEGLVLHLKFDGNLTDASGTANNAECTYGNITYEEGIFGQSAVFNGKSYLEVQDNATLDLCKLTISLWAYKDKDRNYYERVPYLYKEVDEDHWATPYNLYEPQDNCPMIYLHDEDDESELDQFSMTGSPVDLSKWFLLTVTFDGEEARIYENGVLTKKENVEGSTSATLGNLFIGVCDNGEDFFEGKMDDLRVYNRALSSSEVVNLFDAGMATSPQLLTQTNAMVAHYKFNGSLEDATAFDNDAEKVTGKVTYVNGVNGKAAVFGKKTYLEVPHSDSINFDEGYSMTAWVKTYEKDELVPLLNKQGVSTSSDSNDFSYDVSISHDTFDFTFTPFGYQTGYEYSRYSFDGSIQKTWTHIAVTFDQEEVRWYKNGKMVQKDEIDEDLRNSLAHSNEDLMIGSDGEDFFYGEMDELKLYNYKLSADEVMKDYNSKDSLYISKASSGGIRSMKKNATVSLAVYRKYFETGKSSDKLTSGVYYKTSNKKVFTVDKYGKVKAVGKGSAKLTITHGGISKTYTITVK